MKAIPQTRVLIAAVIFDALVFPAFASEPTWARKALAFPEQCTDYGAYRYQDCKPIGIVSPDGRSSIEVFYRPVDRADHQILQAFLRLTAPTQGTREAALPEGFGKIELLWSPDSKAFFVNGAKGGGYRGFWVYVYLVDDPSNPRDVTEDAQRDMLNEFPPCKAAYPNADDAVGCKKTSRPNYDTCMQDEADQKYRREYAYNMTGIDWVKGSVILVMSEIPCSTSYGAIMCQVMGYELQVPTGQILKRIDARQLKRGWQKSMAWNFRIPDPPRYCE